MIERSSGKPLRIAIFNDGHDTIAILTAWFEAHGHRALSARLQDMRRADTEAGIFIERNGADVVVFDVGMPYMSNWDFGEVLQNLPGAAGVPFVLTRSHNVEFE